MPIPGGFHTTATQHREALAASPSGRTVKICSLLPTSESVFPGNSSWDAVVRSTFGPIRLEAFSGLGELLSKAEHDDLMSYLNKSSGVPTEVVSLNWLTQYAGQGREDITSLASLALAREADDRDFLPGMDLIAWSWPINDAIFNFTLTPGKSWHVINPLVKTELPHYTFNSFKQACARLFEQRASVANIPLQGSGNVLENMNCGPSHRLAKADYAAADERTSTYLDDPLSRIRWAGMSPIPPLDTDAQMFMTDSLALAHLAERATWPAG